MCGNLSLLTVLFIMCYFIKKSRNVVVDTEIIRDSNGDYFDDLCEDNCLKYGAVVHQGFCRCESPKSLFLRSENRCISENKFLIQEHCQTWEDELMEVIDTEKKDSEHTFPKKSQQFSCQLEPLISYHNSTKAEWQFFNLSGNVLALYDGGPLSRVAKLKVTQVSQSLTKFKGYILKLGLKCIRRQDGKTDKSCLLFKAQGKISFPLNCSPYSTTSPASPSSITPSITTRTLTRTIIVTSPTTAIPSSVVTPTITCISCTATSTIGPECNGTIKDCDGPLSPAIIAVIVIGGTVLCLLVIVAVYRYTHICRPRGLQARNPDHDFDVISNPGPQTYRMQEEPLYAEVQDISPCDTGSGGSSSSKWEEKATILLNPNAYEARISVQRRTTDPLPSRPELVGNTDTQVDARAVHQNEAREAIGKAGEDSIVFKNPKVEEASSSSLPRSENDLTKLSGAHEPQRQSIGDHRHHHIEDDIDNSTVHLESEGVGEDLDYKELLPGKRPHSVFICPSCNENPVYQKLSMPHNCPHGAKDKPNETYGRLIGLEQGSRESVYAIPTRTAEEPAAEDEGNRNSEEGEGIPEYHTLETVSNQEFSEPVNHDYDVLERPEETGNQVDERAKDCISRDSDQTSGDSDLWLEPSKILHMEDNPVYAKPWKVKEDPELPLEPSDFHNIENTPAYSMPLMPWRTKSAEPCSRKRAYSV